MKMPDFLPNIKLEPGKWVDLYAKSSLAVGSPISIFNITDVTVRIHFGAKPVAGDNSGFRTINKKGDEIHDGQGSTGAWAYSEQAAIINVEQCNNKAPLQPASRDLKPSDYGQAVTHVALSGNTMTFTHGDGAQHSVVIPGGAASPSGLTGEITDLESRLKSQGVDIAAIKAAQGNLNHRISDLGGIYSYRGLTSPDDFPANPKSAYFLNLHNSPGTQTIQIPTTATEMVDGTVFFINNENTTQQLIVRPRTGDSIDNATSITVQPQQFLMLAKNGKNWVRSAVGYLPTGFNDLVNRVAQSLSSQLHISAQITDMLNNWLANPSTQASLDKILKKLGYEKTAPGTDPGSIVAHVGSGADFPTSFTGEYGTYQPHQDIMITGLDRSPAKVWVAIPDNVGHDITGIKIDGGLPATWASKVISIDGKDWNVFISPLVMHEAHLTLTPVWSI
ncbi:conserved hypothetical protein [Vibrio phage 236O40-1]|nr:conserved hypothetical protein [Vibrio phage 236O40-1]